MCGLAGCIDPQRRDEAELTELVREMSFRLAHRGPDDAGVLVDATAGLGLGHRRLAVVDLSPMGHQPMVSGSGRYMVAFNGEIYNFRALRAELDRGGHGFWRGHSDTEVMLAAFDCWGVGAAVTRFNGMFALALWDRRERVLHLVRDRMGEKPLYYGWAGSAFVFGSELKALCAHPSFQRTIDRGVLSLFLRYNFVPGAESIYNGVLRLAPGSILSISADQVAGRTLPSPSAYWSVEFAASLGVANLRTEPVPVLLDELDGLARDAVGLRLEADVPLGAFLSGGVDSSLVAALMQTQAARPVRTFSIGFTEEEFDEAPFARAVAAHLGTDHTELYVTPQEALDVVPRLPILYDEPFADPSSIPTYLVARMAREHVTVALTGDGGDELFCGYGRYAVAEAVWRGSARLPAWSRGVMARALRAFPAGLAPGAIAPLAYLLSRRTRLLNPARGLRRLASLVEEREFEGLYRRLLAQWDHPPVLGGEAEPDTMLSGPLGKALFGVRESMMYLDQRAYLPDDVLCKVDRATMAVALESRVPLLDHRLVEWAWRVPADLKARDRRGKWLLRELLSRYVPRALVDRPKMGFSVPLGAWLRGPLRDWAQDLLSESALNREGFLDPRPIRNVWAEHLSGRANHEYKLWTVLMFQAWIDA